VLADARHARFAIVAGPLALVSAYILVHRSAPLAVAVAALPLLAWTLLRPSRGLALGLVVALTVPTWWNLGGHHSYQYAAVLAAASVLSARRLRFTLIDLALLGYVAVFVLGWLLQYDHPETWRIVRDQLLTLGFYLGARAVPHRRVTALMTLTLFAGTVGALTVIYEFARGSAVFVDPTRYLWNASPGGGLFRPGGIFGSPPGAATVLMYVLLFGLAALRSLQGNARAVGATCIGICAVALVLTFTRAPLIGAGMALLVFLWLVRSPLLRSNRVVMAGIALATAIVLILPTLQGNAVFQAGVARGGTLSARESYWRLALPIASASPHNFVVGVGTGVLETPRLSAGAPLPYVVAATPQVFENSLHNQYVTTLVEQGVVGLAALVLLLVAIFVPTARAARATGDVYYAALAATSVGMAVVLAIDTELLHAPSLIMFLVAAGLAARAGERGETAEVDNSGFARQGPSWMR
jgi:O-antigen ligase